jgi:hypothetical protein
MPSVPSRRLRPRALGARTWTIPDAYLPARGPKGRPGYVGHESLCVLNTGARAARLRIGFYFADREPQTTGILVVGAGRCRHLRFDDPAQLGGFVVPREVPYGLRIDSSVPVVVQHSRLDVTQANMAFLSAMAHPA